MMTTYSVICRWLNFHNLQCANSETAYCCIISFIRDCVRLTRVWPHEIIAKMDVGNGVGRNHFTVSTAPVVASWCSLLCGVIPMNMKGEQNYLSRLSWLYSCEVIGNGQSLVPDVSYWNSP